MSKISTIEIEKAIRGVNFPAKKHEIIKQAEKKQYRSRGKKSN
jgi:hypothetical protein